MLLQEKNLINSLCLAVENAGMTIKHREFGVAHHGGSLDCLIHIATSSGHKRLAVETVGVAYPRDVREVAWQLQSFLNDNEKAEDIILIVAAEHLSEGAKQDLRHHHLAYFEASGTFYLRHKEWLIDIQRPSKPASRRSALALFTDAREQVILTLLIERRTFRSGLELAEMSKTSTYTVSTVLAELERMEWIESEGSGRMLRRRLSKPDELLDAWEKAWTQRKATKSKWHVYASNPAELFGKLAFKIDAVALQGGVFTGPAAANRIVPHLTRTDAIDIIIPPGEAAYYAGAFMMKSVEKGGNVTLVERSGASLMFPVKDPSSRALLANPFILYLDLLDGRGRNKELAEQLRLYALGM